jgi:hypothetical protein
MPSTSQMTPGIVATTVSSSRTQVHLRDEVPGITTFPTGLSLTGWAIVVIVAESVRRIDSVMLLDFIADDAPREITVSTHTR